MVKEEKQLIIMAQRGDMKSFEQIVSIYDRQVLNIAYSFRNDEDDAKDIYQEVFIRVFRGIKKFQFKCEFSTWLYRITTNVCISQSNKKNRHLIDSLDRPVSDDQESDTLVGETLDSGIDTGKENEKKELTELINSSLNHLPAKQKMAFVLKYYRGYKIREIAEMMNINEGTIKRYIFNATKKLRELLASKIDNEIFN